MKQITFYLDFISPYAYLAFEELPQALMGLSYSVSYQPILFAALLKHHGQLGPAEIAGKREWTYRQVLWLAHSKGVDLQMPATHPFNPLGLLRLAVASDPGGKPNRYVCETLFRHVWTGGGDAANTERLSALTQDIAPGRDPGSASVKADLQAHGDAALAQGVFGVPTLVVDGKAFWGQDALPMLRSYLAGDAWFSEAHWDGVQHIPSGVPPRKA